MLLTGRDAVVCVIDPSYSRTNVHVCLKWQPDPTVNVEEIKAGQGKWSPVRPQ